MSERQKRYKNIKAPGGAGTSVLEQHQRDAGLTPFCPEKEHQTQLWHFLPLFKNRSLFLSDVWKKEVDPQSPGV